MTYDIVIPVKPAEVNEDLRYTLRALDKFGRNFGTVWITGFTPSWVTGVRSIPVRQDSGKWENARLNMLAACNEPEVSDTFILYNDDFILTAPITDWDEATNLYLGTLKEHGDRFGKNGKLDSKWRKGFHFNDDLLKRLGVTMPFDYEYHGPFLYNKRFFPTIFNIGMIKDRRFKYPALLFNRSIYGNLFPRPEPARRIRDSKLNHDFESEDELTRNGFFSVYDNAIGNKAAYPRLNAWLAKHLGEPCRFEKA